MNIHSIGLKMGTIDKRYAIMKATLDLVAEQGFHGAPMALVAERAEVAAGTIYRYFDNKDALIKETYLYLVERFFSEIMENYPEGESVRNRFVHIGKVLVRYYTVNAPLEFRFIEQFHNSPYGVAHRREKFFGKKEKDVITELFNEAMAAGIVKEFPLPILFALSFGPLLDICRDHILNFIQLDEPLIVRCVEACWDALKY
jgi:AcrR family transcriptional regulator